MLCDIVFKTIIPTEVERYFTDTYLFCLYKDPEDLSKLRPLGTPLAPRRLVATHLAAYYRQPFAKKLLLINYAIGVDRGMDFGINSFVVKSVLAPRQKQSTQYVAPRRNK